MNRQTFTKAILAAGLFVAIFTACQKSSEPELSTKNMVSAARSNGKNPIKGVQNIDNSIKEDYEL